MRQIFSAIPLPLRIAGALLVVVTMSAFVALIFLASIERPGDAQRRAVELPPIDLDIDELQFVGRQACAQCHQTEHDKWMGSDHQMAQDYATQETVLADFDDTTFTHQGITTRFFRDNGRFMVYTEGPDGKMDTFEVKYVFGYDPLQQYLVEFPDGRVQCLTIAWATHEKRWFHLYPDEVIPHDDPLHWTGRLMNWNYMCVECHTTDLHKNYDVDTDTYDTTFKEINVSCEACHGPGSAHVEWAKAKGLTGGDFFGDPDEMRLAFRMKGMPNQVQIQMCAQCHSRRSVIHPGYRPGKSFYDHYSLELLNEGTYHPDGQILDEVFEYGSFLQSRMYHEGVKCTDCHDPHTTRLRFTGNRLCIQCHEADRYDVYEHHFHPRGTTGTLCVECHMPQETYMIVDPRRDHSFQSPRPDLTMSMGVPNACNDCHTEESPEWAYDWIVQWYGPDRYNDPHFAPIIAAGREGRPEAETELIDLALDRDRPGIIRATAVSLLRQYRTQAARDTAAALLDDDQVLVRIEAVRLLDSQPDERLVERVSPRLEDQFRGVRIEAARTLAVNVPHQFTDRTRPEQSAFWNALEEYKTGLRENADQPEAHLNVGVLHESFNRPEQAEQAYRIGLKLDQANVPLLNNLAVLLSRRGENVEAEALLRKAVELEPQVGDLHYSLGLLVAEDPRRLPEAVRHLAQAATLMPEHARVRYNLGLALQYLQQDREAEQMLLRAYQLERDNEQFLVALMQFYGQRGQWDRAAYFARLLVQLRPDHPPYRQVLQDIERRLSQDP